MSSLRINALICQVANTNHAARPVHRGDPRCGSPPGEIRRPQPVIGRFAQVGAIDRARDAGLILLALDCYGGSNRCLDMTAKYALTREQFGQIIGAFQGVKHQLADLATDLAPSLSLCWYAAHAFDHMPDKSERHAAITKAHMTDVYDKVTRYAIELHGGIGFTWEYDLHLWWRRAVFDRAYLGEATYHRLRAADLAGW